MEVRRLETSMREQEALNRHLQLKEIEGKAHIKQLSQQLEETLNKIHDAQAKGKFV